jgi:hypothetical protein
MTEGHVSVWNGTLRMGGDIEPRKRVGMWDRPAPQWEVHSDVSKTLEKPERVVDGEPCKRPAYPCDVAAWIDIRSLADVDCFLVVFYPSFFYR